MTGYVFIYGVDGFGADTAPAHENGCYLNFKKAFNRLVELNHEKIKKNDYFIYEKGYGEDYYPKTDKELAKAEKENWDLFDELMNQHILKDEIEINKRLLEYEEIPFGFYGLEKIEIIE